MRQKFSEWRRSDLFQRLFQVGGDIADVFQTDGNADQTAVDSGSFQLFLGELAVSRRCRVQHAGADVCHVYLDGRQLERIHKPDGCLSAAFDGDGDNAAGAVRQILFW